MIMSSWPPTIRRRPSSSRISTVGIEYRSLARSAWRRKLEYTPGVAEGERLPVHPHRTVLDRTDEIVGRVHQRDADRTHAPSRAGSRRR